MSEKHEKSRSSLCLVCNDRATSTIKPGSALLSHVQNFLVENYNPCDLRLPCGMCDSCRIKLAKYAKGDFAPVLPKLPSYKDMLNFRLTRKTSQSCECQLCETNKIAGRHGFRQKLTKRKRGLPRKVNKNNSEKPLPRSLCLECFGLVVIGGEHECVKKNDAINRIRSAIPQRTLEIVANDILKEKRESHGRESTYILNDKKFRSSTKKVKVGRIKNETFELAKLESGVSTRQLLAIKKVIQKDVNVESTSSLKSHMKMVNDLYSDLFCIEEVKIDNEIVPIVYVVPKFISRILSFREDEVIEDVFLRLNIDEGQSFLKITGSLVQRTPSEEIGPFKSSGVLGIAPIKENYQNIQLLLSKLKLESLPTDFEHAR